MLSAALATVMDDFCKPATEEFKASIIIQVYDNFINVFLILFGIVSVMKLFLISLSLAATIMTTGCADPYSDKKSGWFFGAGRPLEWPERHWIGKTYRPTIDEPQYSLPAALDRDRSMFDTADIEAMTPDQLISNLRRADIIESVYHEQTGFSFFKKPTGNIIVETDYNFYTLAKADQKIITELLAQSYDTDLLLLKDTHTHRTVGQLSTEGYALF